MSVDGVEPEAGVGRLVGVSVVPGGGVVVCPGRGDEGNVRVAEVDGASVGTADVPCALSGDGRGLESQATMITTATTIRSPGMYNFSLTHRPLTHRR